MRDFKIVVLLFLGAAFAPSAISGCATFSAIGKTVSDAGAILCNLYAVEVEATSPEQLQGMSAAVWCAVHENLKPFIDEALAAKQSVATSLQRPESTSGGESATEAPADGAGMPSGASEGGASILQ